MDRPTNKYVLNFGLLVLVLTMAAEVFLHFNPGALSSDSLSILRQARSGILEDGHPPLMAAIWRLVDRVLPGSIGMLLLNLALFYGGLYLIFYWAGQRYHYLALLALVVVGLFPPIIAILGVIWIDITMTSLFLAALGCFLVGNTSNSNKTQVITLLSALSLTALGLSIRHNGAAGAFPLIAFFLYQSRYIQTSKKLQSRLSLAIFGGAIITALMFVGSKQFSASYVDVKLHLWRVGALYDIAGISYHKKLNLFYPDVIDENSFENIEKLYSPRSFTPLVIGEQVHSLPGEISVRGRPFSLNITNPNLSERLLLNWRDAIFHHPRAYLKHRYDVFESLVTRSPWGLWTTVFDMVYPNTLGIAERPVFDSSYFRFVRSLAQRSAIFVPLLYLTISVLAVFPMLIYGLKLKRNTLLIAASLYGSGITHMTGLFFVTASADSRYSHWLITSTVLATSLVLMELMHMALDKRASRRAAEAVRRLGG